MKNLSEEQKKELENLRNQFKNHSNSLPAATYLKGNPYEIRRAETYQLILNLEDQDPELPLAVRSKPKWRNTTPYKKCKGKGK